MRTEAQSEFEKCMAEIRGLYLTIWLLFIAGTLLAFALGLFLGRLHCPAR